MLDNWIEPVIDCVFLGHVTKPVVDAPEILQLELLLLLHSLVLENLLTLLDHSLSHSHNLLHILVLELDDLLESLLIEAQEARIVLLGRGKRSGRKPELAWYRRHRARL
jgi:hypothetical protein